MNLHGYPPTYAQLGGMLGTKSAAAISDHLRLLAEKGRVSHSQTRGLGRGYGSGRSIGILKPLTRDERRAFGFPADETLGEFYTPQFCIVCKTARLFDGITQCLECRAKCDNSNPG